jgi:hypothetical protein
LENAEQRKSTWMNGQKWEIELQEIFLTKRIPFDLAQALETEGRSFQGGPMVTVIAAHP